MEIGISIIPVSAASAIVHPEIARVVVGTAWSGSAHRFLQFFKYLELPAISCSISVTGPGTYILHHNFKI